jgi:transcriptional regulator with XRE-family HTH domain
LLDAKEIGARLRKLRGERTIAKVSEDTGIGVSALTMYELGNRIPRDEAKLALAGYYGVTVDSLFFNKNFT